MPRKAEILPDILEDHLRKWPIFDDNKELKSGKNQVWMDIKKSLGLKMAAKSIFLHVRNNRQNLRSNLENYHGIKIEPKVKKNLDPEYRPVKSNNPYNCDLLQFDFVVASNLVCCIPSKEKNSDWTDNVRDNIWDKKSLPCTFTFPNSYFCQNSFKFNGYCSDCFRSIRGEGVDVEDNMIKISIYTYETCSVPHTKKLKLARTRRKLKKNILLNKSAAGLREEEFGKVETDYEPPHLNNTVTYRKAKEEAINEEIEYDKFKKLPISNKELIIACYIKKLCLHPFYAIYYTKTQVDLWNSVCDQRLPLSLDSTGSLVRRYKYGPIKSKNIFFYVLVVGIGGKIIPLLQALLSIHHVAIIMEVLQNWIENGATIPKEIVTDGSLALQNAITLAFNSMTFNTYNLQCFKILQNESSEIPRCFYRHDVAHLLKMVRDWKCFKLCDPNMISFYLRCVGYLSQVETLDIFEDVITSIIVVCNSTVIEENTECFKRKESLKHTFKTYQHILQKLESSIVDFSITVGKKEEKSRGKKNKNMNELTKRIDNLFEEALKLSCTKEEISECANFYYCPSFTKNFKQLCYTFVTWTNVMATHFTSSNAVATSARSEAFFMRLKQKIPRPISVVKFLLKEKLRIFCLMKMGSIYLSKIKIDTKETKPFQCAITDSLSTVHHIQGSLIRKKMDIDTNVTEPSHCAITQSSINTVGNTRRSLILNGLRLPAKMYEISKGIVKNTLFINKCPFDSIFEILCTMYIENLAFRKDVNECYNLDPRLFLTTIKNYCVHFSTQLFYEDRANILYTVYRSEASRMTEYTINCKDNVTRLFKVIMNFLPSYIRSTKCNMCQFKKERSEFLISLSVSEYYMLGVEQLEIILENRLRERISYCEKCNEKSALQMYEINNYIAIDVEYLHEKKNRQLFYNTVKQELPFRTNFKKIPTQIILKNNVYKLKAVICFQGDCDAVSDDVLVHYYTLTQIPILGHCLMI